GLCDRPRLCGRPGVAVHAVGPAGPALSRDVFSPLSPLGRGAGGEGRSLQPLTPDPSPRWGEGGRSSLSPAGRGEPTGGADEVRLPQPDRAERRGRRAGRPGRGGPRPQTPGPAAAGGPADGGPARCGEPVAPGRQGAVDGRRRAVAGRCPPGAAVGPDRG